jgi:hypothetical protein
MYPKGNSIRKNSFDFVLAFAFSNETVSTREQLEMVVRMQDGANHPILISLTH